MTYKHRLWLALHLPLWTHCYLLTREEILSYNEKAYDEWRESVGLPFSRH